MKSDEVRQEFPEVLRLYLLTAGILGKKESEIVEAISLSPEDGSSHGARSLVGRAQGPTLHGW